MPGSTYYVASTVIPGIVDRVVHSVLVRPTIGAVRSLSTCRRALVVGVYCSIELALSLDGKVD